MGQLPTPANCLVGGFSPTPRKNDGVKVSWDDEIPNTWKVIKFHGSKPPTSCGWLQNAPGIVESL